MIVQIGPCLLGLDFSKFHSHEGSLIFSTFSFLSCSRPPLRKMSSFHKGSLIFPLLLCSGPSLTQKLCSCEGSFLSFWSVDKGCDGRHIKAELEANSRLIVLWGCCRKVIWSDEACGQPASCREIAPRAGACPFTGHFLGGRQMKLLAWTGG